MHTTPRCAPPAAPVITGLPDTYGRGRIVGDYRRVALYGIDRLIAGKQDDLNNCGGRTMTDDIVRQREEIADQIRALKGMKEMAKAYGYDISQPARDAHEAVQWLYFGYLAAIKTQNGAAMSVGRVSTFLDIYIQRDLATGKIDEQQAQELIDHLVLKLRIVKFARIPSYQALFSGDPVWATLEVAGLGQDGRHMVTKNDYRFLHTLENMGPAPEPNLTVLYSKRLPDNFRKYAAKISVNTSSIQYENDDVMRPVWGDDYPSAAASLPPRRAGDAVSLAPAPTSPRRSTTPSTAQGRSSSTSRATTCRSGRSTHSVTSEYLDYDEAAQVRPQDGLAGRPLTSISSTSSSTCTTSNTTRLPRWPHRYERRTFGHGHRRLSHVVDSISAMKYARVKTVRDEQASSSTTREG